MKARIIINNVATNGTFSKSFLLKLYRMGAEITVFLDGETLFMETHYDYIKNYKGS